MLIGETAFYVQLGRGGHRPTMIVALAVFICVFICGRVPGSVLRQTLGNRRLRRTEVLSLPCDFEFLLPKERVFAALRPSP